VAKKLVTYGVLLFTCHLDVLLFTCTPQRDCESNTFKESVATLLVTYG
jgi:hypothetical protein